ncbi:dihydrolipoyl dehydrogenase [Desulfosarcina ovata subsp. sediminis]|uniref:Dihydrolipoyl dehydrogenase n=1 Tax=Desulfosarcina ovata subsp. sediminis TaxID=885957 RepID=A0A5K7ZWG2_9BACT|nr:dihydrolipoyl dehydrogenase [Desulfosarcina ovata]BBO84450.1 dihydrolipoyl dehydrogenase [Desulfosarcina ovata subsp. sediminis]
MAQETRFDLVIIGSGPGGYVAAVRAAQLGMKTAVVEKSSRLGGVCLNVGCIPSKALLDASEYYHLAKERFAEYGIKTGKVGLDLATMLARKDQVVEDLTENVRKLLEGNHIEVIHGLATLAAPGAVDVDTGKKKKLTLSAGNILLATGSEPLEVKGLTFDGEYIVSSTEALSFDSVPGRLGIVGGGYIGLELGSVWNRLGSTVTVIEMLPKIAANLDGQVGRTLDRILKRQGMQFKVGTRVVEATVSGKTVKTVLATGDKTETMTFDRLLVSVGRRPLTRGLGLEALAVETDERTGQIVVDQEYRTSVKGIYAIGDLVPGPMLAHKASAEGTAAVECMAGRAGEVNYDTIPAVVYTWPEVASVGLTEEQVREREIPYCVGSFPFSGAGRARCMGETDGFVKLISHGKTDRILGVHIIGPRAADMIAECVLALEFGASSEDIARTIHGHPTFSEALQEAAMHVRQCSIYAS